MVPISIDSGELFLNITKFYQEYEKNLTSPLMYMKFLDHLQPTLLKEKVKKPRIEYVAPDVDTMLKYKKKIIDIVDEKDPSEKAKRLLDLGCRKIVHPDKYTVNLYGKEYEIWTGSSLKGIKLRIGYVDGDSRIMSSLGLDDDNAHFKVGARTGAGKSVLLNDMIMSGMIEYPPFENIFYLFDLKIVEMSRYGNKVKAPHVSCIGATEDIDFIISALYHFEREMRKMQELFGLFGYQKLAQLRNSCNMIVPHKTAIIDEFTQLFELAASYQVKEITELLSSVVRLGRATGYHLGICSQNFSGTLDKALLGNFKASIALPCTQETSTALIGNDMAGFLKGKGKCYSNELSGKKEENIMHSVPFIENEKDDCPFLVCIRGLKDLSDSYGYSNVLNFYVENDQKEGIVENVSTYDLKDNDIIILGDTTRYKTDEDPTEYIRLKRESGQNILVVSQDIDDLIYAQKLILASLKEKHKPTFIEVRGDFLASDYFNIGEFVELDLLDKSQNVSDESYWEEILNIVTIRKEILLRGETSGNEDAIELMNNMKEHYKVDEIESYHFNPIYVIVNGAQEIKGIGKSQDSRFMSRLSEIMDEAPKYGVHFIFTIDKITDRINTYVDLFVHRFFGNLHSKDQTKLTYDSSKMKPTCLAYQNSKELGKEYKFKKYKEKFNKPEIKSLRKRKVV